MQVDNFHLITVILAAGKSERFGTIKQLAAIDHHRRPLHMLHHSFLQLNGLAEKTLVATGKYHEKITSILSEDTHFYRCPNADLGMGHTIADATNYVSTHFPQCTHLMFALADQVAIQSPHYLRLITAALGHPTKLICAETNSGFSAPAIFPRWAFQDLKQLTGDKGAKRVLNEHQGEVIAIDIEEAEIDIDTVEDLHNWNNNINKDPIREQA